MRVHQGVARPVKGPVTRMCESALRCGQASPAHHDVGPLAPAAERDLGPRAVTAAPHVLAQVVRAAQQLCDRGEPRVMVLVGERVVA